MATRSPFLDTVASGDVPQEALARWLAQDYLFAEGLLQFQSVALSKMPRCCHKTLIRGLVALDSELEWFESHAERLGLALGGEAHPVCRRYVDFLLRAAYTASRPVLLAILFAVEVSYFAAWSALPAQGPYREFIERWSTPAFAEYAHTLGRLAEDFRDPDQQPHFNRVLELERDFWRMSWEG